MNKATSRPAAARTRYLPVVVMAFVVGIFGAAILLVSARLRLNIREQIIRRDGAVLQAVALMQQYSAEATDDLGSLIEDPMDQLSVILETSRLKDVIAVRLFDSSGQFLTAFPPNVREGQLAAQDLARLNQFQPVCHYIAHGDLSDHFWDGSAKEAGSRRPLPLLEVIIPIQPKAQPRLVGLAQFVLDGQGVAGEYAQLDWHLLRHGLAVFFVGGGVMATTLGWAFRRLARVNRLLRERTDSLLRANQELSLAAKTSAVGAVTAHLIHGLQNPLLGLQNFVASRSSMPGNPTEPDWQIAVATAGRMKAMINEIVRVLRDEQGAATYEISWGELAEILTARISPAAREAGVHFWVHQSAEGALSNRDANLIVLILENLIQNALQATPAGKSVNLNLIAEGQNIRCEVQDEGPGLAPEPRATLFSPCQSTKEGGSGIGLALSKQLAQHLGAALELKLSSPCGCVFSLSVPNPRLKTPESASPEPPGLTD